MERPAKATTAGQAFLALRTKALLAGRTTAEYLRLYALEGFLLRLANSSHKNNFVLKGGVLLAAYELRRPTADVDLAAIQTPNEVEPVRKLVADIAATRLPEGLDDGLIFDLNDVRAETIREGDIYRVTREHSFLAGDIAQALRTVAEFRKVGLSGLDEGLDGYAEIGQRRWEPWRTKLQLSELLPADFGDALEALRAFANPILTGTVADSATWNPELGMWEHADSDR
jgi:hypothetical protein